MGIIEIQNLSKTFAGPNGGTVALNNVNISINKGDIFGVIGLSGAGKSTLVRCINLLERPDSGKVIIDGVDFTTLKAKVLREERKKIGMIFQQFNLFKSRTVMGNILFPLRHTKMSKEEKIKKARSLLKLVDLSVKENAYPSELSGGQKQRVAIARALACDPKILLCDEATSALDPQTTASIIHLIKKLSRMLGITVVVITHEMAVIKEICNRVAVMENGVMVEGGSVFDVFANPQTQLTRDFVRMTSNVSRIDTLIEEDSPLVKVSGNQRICKFTYHSEVVSESLISNASREFDVSLNILFGNVEIIDNKPIGALIVKLDGEQGSVESSIAYFQKNGVTVEVLK